MPNKNRLRTLVEKVMARSFSSTSASPQASVLSQDSHTGCSSIAEFQDSYHGGSNFGLQESYHGGSIVGLQDSAHHGSSTFGFNDSQYGGSTLGLEEFQQGGSNPRISSVASIVEENTSQRSDSDEECNIGEWLREARSRLTSPLQDTTYRSESSTCRPPWLGYQTKPLRKPKPTPVTTKTNPVESDDSWLIKARRRLNKTSPSSVGLNPTPTCVKRKDDWWQNAPRPRPSLYNTFKRVTPLADDWWIQPTDEPRSTSPFDRHAASNKTDDFWQFTTARPRSASPSYRCRTYSSSDNRDTGCQNTTRARSMSPHGRRTNFRSDDDWIINPPFADKPSQTSSRSRCSASAKREDDWWISDNTCPRSPTGCNRVSTATRDIGNIWLQKARKTLRGCGGTSTSCGGCGGTSTSCRDCGGK